MSRQFGDFQTPPGLVGEVLRAVCRRGGPWSRALEPTCGIGNFIVGLRSLAIPPREVQGIEIQPGHAARTQVGSDGHTTIHHADIFRLNLSELRWSESGPLLVVGNPPWVTSAELGGLESSNVPTKSNFKGNTGFDAKTGGANFDIAEFIWIKLIKELAWAQPTIALLCKTAVARNVLSYAESTGLPLSNPEIFLIDAKKWFNAAVDACLFRVDVGLGEPSYQANIYADLDSEVPQGVLGITDGGLVSNCEAYERLSFLDGVSPVVWRQGLKHDIAAVMELSEDEGILTNRLGEVVSIEPSYLYPLLKSSDLNNPENRPARYQVIVTQKHLGQDTGHLRDTAPRLWEYLCSHEMAFAARKSSIYEGRPAFSIFGIGEYSFAEYKVAVSGMYKTVRFKLVGPEKGRPVMLDDTCYFIPCDSAEQGAIITALLNEESCLSFVNSLIFLDSKRPVTKKVLQRLDLSALLHRIDPRTIAVAANQRLSLLGFPEIGADAIDQFVWPGTGGIQGSMFPELTA
jgi:hypothetical protein